MKLVMVGFSMPEGREAEVYGVLRAVRDQSLTETKVGAIVFGETGTVTVCFEPRPGSFHAGPVAYATREASGWRIGELMHLQ